MRNLGLGFLHSDSLWNPCAHLLPIQFLCLASFSLKAPWLSAKLNCSWILQLSLGRMILAVSYGCASHIAASYISGGQFVALDDRQLESPWYLDLC